MARSVLLRVQVNQYSSSRIRGRQRARCTGLAAESLGLCWSRWRPMLASMPAVVAAPIVSTPSGAAPVARASAPATVSPPQVMLALLAVYVIWGSTYLVMRWAVSELPPMLMGGIRFSVAGGILYAIARLRSAPAPSLRHWINGFAVGGLLFVGGNGFVAIAERSVSS